jgi:hypothetical protein
VDRRSAASRPGLLRLDARLFVVGEGDRLRCFFAGPSATGAFKVPSDVMEASSATTAGSRVIFIALAASGGRAAIPAAVLRIAVGSFLASREASSLLDSCRA